MIICGKRFAICCSVLSCWAIIMLLLMGILLYSHALAFVEDLDIPLHDMHTKDRNVLISEAYNKFENAVSLS